MRAGGCESQKDGGRVRTRTRYVEVAVGAVLASLLLSGALGALVPALGAASGSIATPRAGSGASPPGAVLLEDAQRSLRSAHPISAGSSTKWSQLHPVGSPPELQAASMTYDAKDGYVVLFGGTNGFFALSSETWKYQAGNWTELFPTISPPARYGATMTYDGHDGYVVLFGGDTSTTSGAALNDTWKFVHGQWSDISRSVSPPARIWSGMTYDARDGYVVLFGGQGCVTPTTCADLGDTWDFISGVWINVTQPSGPSARYLPNLAYDATDGYVILYGGESTSAIETDTWKFVSGVWTNITPSTSPNDQSSYSSLAYDPVLGGVILFGGEPTHCTGCTVPAPSVDYTWMFSGGSWTNLSLHHAPSGRSEAAMAFDGTSAGALLLFGGNLYGYFSATASLNDTWKLM